MFMKDVLNTHKTESPYLYADVLPCCDVCTAEGLDHDSADVIYEDGRAVDLMARP